MADTPTPLTAENTRFAEVKQIARANILATDTGEILHENIGIYVVVTPQAPALTSEPSSFTNHVKHTEALTEFEPLMRERAGLTPSDILFYSNGKITPAAIESVFSRISQDNDIARQHGFVDSSKNATLTHITRRTA